MDAEDIVRKYLDYLEDPSVIRDDEAIAETKRRAAEATDKIERLRLLSEVERLEDPTADDLHEAFVATVKEWADHEDVTPGSLIKLGVPPGVLREAGFDLGGPAPRQPRSTRRASSRGPGVSVEAVRAAVPAEGTFTTKDLREASGASPGTVRKAMAAMLDAGEIVDRGPHPAWDGPGRVPTLYERA